MSKETKKATSAPKAEAPAKVEETKKKLIGTKELAARLGTTGTTLRRYLRSLPAYQDNSYSRYGWEPDDPFLKDVEASFKKYQTSETEKKAKREAEAKEKASEEKAPAKAKKGKKQPEPEPEEDEDEEFLDEDEVEEIE